MKYITLMLLLLGCLQLFAGETNEPLGVAVFKLKPEYRTALQRTPDRMGILSLDRKLEALEVKLVKPHYNITSPRFMASELSLIFAVSSPRHPIAVVNVLRNDPHVQYAEVVYPDELLDAPLDTYYSASLYFAALEAEAAWSIHKGEDGAGVVIAVVDTGTKWNHADLGQNIWNNLGEDANGNGYTLYHNGSAWVMDSGDINGIDDDANGKIDDLIGWDFMVNSAGDEGNDPVDNWGHGTAVSGITDSSTNNTIGVSSLAWNLKLMPISCDTSTGYITKGYDAIIYAAENGADIINCSWGGLTYSQAAQDAINYAYGLGSILVAAAGNNGGNNNRAEPLYPSAYQGVLSTAALQNTGVKNAGSSYGASVDFCAPNLAIWSTNSGGGYSFLNSGVTSFASPIAAALAGLTKSYYPALTQEQIITRIKGSCDDVDSLNPGLENMLGEGKLNARRALEEADPQPDNEVRLGIIENRGATDANGNRAVEPNELFSVNLYLRNWGSGPANATYTLSTTSSAVTILSNSEVGVLNADSYFLLENAFSIQASPTAASQYVTFTLQTTADIPVVVGGSLSFSILIHNGGVFVWEGVGGGRNMSGTYIRTTLQGLGYSCVYNSGNTFPPSFYSFAAVFLSFGVPGSNIYRFSTGQMFTALREYLEDGGKVYIEGADVVGYDMATYLPDVEGNLDAHEILWPLLGIQSATDGATNVIDNLYGYPDTPTAGISFTSSAQTVNNYIDTFTPTPFYAKAAFSESDYATVAVAAAGSYGQRSFVFSYALRELTDGVLPNTRANLLTQIMAFFESTEFFGDMEVPILTITQDEGIVMVSWDPTANANHYLVYVSDTPDDWTGIVPIEVFDPEYSLTSESKKFFRVVAVSN